MPQCSSQGDLVALVGERRGDRPVWKVSMQGSENVRARETGGESRLEWHEDVGQKMQRAGNS